jgi:hypothetical protein
LPDNCIIEDATPVSAPFLPERQGMTGVPHPPHLRWCTYLVYVGIIEMFIEDRMADHQIDAYGVKEEYGSPT